MKIIGTTGTGGYASDEFICTVTRGEIEKLIGYYLNSDRRMPNLAVGSVISIEKMYEIARQSRSVRESLAASVSTLRACAELVAGQVALVTPVEPKQ